MRNDVVRDPADPSSVDVVLKFTRHGPVLWDDGKRALALRWVGSEPGTAGYLASLAIDRAQNWEQFEAAVTRWKVPSENLVYADTEGNIGEHSAGLAPIRKWTGLLPVIGAGSTGWLRPRWPVAAFFNPKEGYRHRQSQVIPDHYPYNVGFRWTSPYRIQIRSVFTNAKEHNHKLTLPDLAFLKTTSLRCQRWNSSCCGHYAPERSLVACVFWSGMANSNVVWRSGTVQSGKPDSQWAGGRFSKNRGAAQVLSGRYKDLRPTRSWDSGFRGWCLVKPDN